MLVYKLGNRKHHFRQNRLTEYSRGYRHARKPFRSHVPIYNAVDAQKGMSHLIHLRRIYKLLMCQNYHFNHMVYNTICARFYETDPHFKKFYQ